MTEDAVLYERKGDVAIITLNRPEKRNVFGNEVSAGMRDGFNRVAADDSIRAVILTGNGTAFCAGVDLKDPEVHAGTDVGAHVGVSSGDGSGELRPQSGQERHNWDFIPRLAAPVIAAVNGYCYGVGIEIAMNCDIVIASDRAKFGMQHIRWGLYSGGGGLARTAAAAGKNRAAYYALTGEPFDAETALSMGVASIVVPHDDLMAFAEEKANVICQWSPLAVKYTKECIRQVTEDPLAQVEKTDHYRIFTMYSTSDREEGHKAFVEKREPSYKGS